MKLYYYQRFKNFGDILNTWLWPQLLPKMFDEDMGSIFVGIGTLLNDEIPQAPFKVVFGAGVGYGKRLPAINKNWKIYCVRGPLSAQALAIDPQLAITDPAVLLKKINLPPKNKCYSVSFMPHWYSAKWKNWEPIRQSTGLHIINPQWDIEQVLHDIQCSELIIAEAMHGAIVADALRIPWIPVQVNKGILDFKWHDWCQSVGLEYNPIYLPRLYSEEKILSAFRDKFRSMGFYNNPVTKIPAQIFELSMRSALHSINTLLSNKTSKILMKIVKNVDPILSSDQAISSVTSRLEEKLEQFKADYASGCLLSAKKEGQLHIN